MTYYESQQQNSGQNWQFNPQQWGAFNAQAAQPYGAWSGSPSMQAMGGYGLGGYGQAAHGQQYGDQQYGQHGGQPSIGAFGYNPGWGAQPQWGGQQWGGQQQRQLSQQDVSEVVRQLVPILPQILAQAQSPHAAIGYAAYGQAPRQLSQQDVNEVVRQILPIVPQIVGMLQGQSQPQYGAMQGGGLGFGQQGIGQQGFGQQGYGQQGFGQFALGNPLQNFGTPFGGPQFQAAFGAPFGWGQQQRQLTQQDVADVTRQLIGVIPQVIGNLQAFNQQRMI
jgi:hypothetical protein